MKIACLGGGPAGLYFGISAKLRDPRVEVAVYERNRPGDTFGWGVVLSDETLGNLARNDPVSAASIRDHFAYWDDVATVVDGAREVSGGHGFCGIGRKRLLNILEGRAADLGVALHFGTEVASADDMAATHDLVVAADGLNSRTRAAHAGHFRPQTDLRACKFVWLGTTQTFSDAFTFIFERTAHGWVWAHAYQFEPGTATFIVECAQATWDAFGFGAMSQAESVAACEAIFAAHLGGHPLMSNAAHVRGSAWINFPRVLCERWSIGNVVLMGDAAATAHFSIGSGTKLALESAIALADALRDEGGIPAALARYEVERRREVLRLQSAALNSLEWFENVDRYLGFAPVQLGYAMLTRSQRIGHENLRRRDPAWLERAERWFQTQAGVADGAPVRTPAEAPLALRGLTLEGRVVTRGAAPGDVGGAALICTPRVDAAAAEAWMRAASAGGARTCCCLGDATPEAVERVASAGFDMLEVDDAADIAAVRAAWPADRPLAVRMVVTNAGAAVAAARAFRDAGVDLIVPEPADDGARRGRMYQAPLADRIRNGAGVPTMAAGHVDSADQANGILLAGRADLVALDRSAPAGMAAVA